MKPLNGLICYTVARVTLVGLFSIAAADRAFSQADFYSGKTITIIRGGGPGGSGEFQTRALMRVLGKHIPGRPSFTLQYVEGAAGRKATNVIYSSTRADGLTIGSLGAGLVVGPILGLPGSAYDLDKLIYLGSTDSGDSYILYTKGGWIPCKSCDLQAASDSALRALAIQSILPRGCSPIFLI